MLLNYLRISQNCCVLDHFYGKFQILPTSSSYPSPCNCVLPEGFPLKYVLLSSLKSVEPFWFQCVLDRGSEGTL
jgi:hypothetical protein